VLQYIQYNNVDITLNMQRASSNVSIRPEHTRMEKSYLVINYSLLTVHDQNKSGFLEGRLFSSQSEQFKKYSKSSDWLEKSRPSIKATFVLTCKQAIKTSSPQ